MQHIYNIAIYNFTIKLMSIHILSIFSPLRMVLKELKIVENFNFNFNFNFNHEIVYCNIVHFAGHFAS